MLHASAKTNDDVITGRLLGKALWPVSFVVVAVGAPGLTPWDAMAQVLESRGVADAEAQLLALAAGYTLPATASFLVVTVIEQLRS